MWRSRDCCMKKAIKSGFFKRPSFEAVYWFICGRRRVAVARYRMICLVFAVLMLRLVFRGRPFNSEGWGRCHFLEINILTLKGHRHDWGQCLFTKIIWHENLLEFLQKVIQKCTNHFGKEWAINRAEITHKSLYFVNIGTSPLCL